MFGFIANCMSTMLRWAIYLALAGQLGLYVADMKPKAGKAVKNGLINLRSINDAFHKRN